MRSSADAAVKHKHYYQTLYLEKRSLIGRWFFTFFLAFVAKYRLWSELCFLYIQLLICPHAVHVLRDFMFESWHYLISSVFSGKRKNIYKRKQSEETTNNNRKRLLSKGIKVLAKGVVKRTYKYESVVWRKTTSWDKSCDESEDKSYGQQRIKTLTGGTVLPCPSHLAPSTDVKIVRWRTIIWRILESVLWELVSFFITIHYRCVLGFVSSLSFEPHEFLTSLLFLCTFFIYAMRERAD